jgi:hypothetical protein
MTPIGHRNPLSFNKNRTMTSPPQAHDEQRNNIPNDSAKALIIVRNPNSILVSFVPYQQKLHPTSIWVTPSSFVEETVAY